MFHPQEFFKVVVVADSSGQLSSSAYIVSQEALVAEGNDLDESVLEVGGSLGGSHIHQHATNHNLPCKTSHACRLIAPY